MHNEKWRRHDDVIIGIYRSFVGKNTGKYIRYFFLGNGIWIEVGNYVISHVIGDVIGDKGY